MSASKRINTARLRDLAQSISELLDTASTLSCENFQSHLYAMAGARTSLLQAEMNLMLDDLESSVHPNYDPLDCTGLESNARPANTRHRRSQGEATGTPRIESSEVAPASIGEAQSINAIVNDILVRIIKDV